MARLNRLAAALFACTSLACAARAQENQQGDAARGVELLRRKDYRGAATALEAAAKRDKSDAYVWGQLGLAYTHTGDAKKARDAFEKAVKLRPASADAHAKLAFALLKLEKLRDAGRRAAHALTLDAKSVDAHYVLGAVALRSNDHPKALAEADEVLRLNPNHSPALLLRAQALIGQAVGDVLDEDEEPTALQKSRLDEASAALERLIKLNPDVPGVTGWREQLDAVRIYAGVAAEAKPARTTFTWKEVAQKAVIFSKPAPCFTEEARINGVQGVVRLRLILGADGNAKFPLVIKGLPHGLTECAVAAARGIRFTPATMEGRPVSQVVTIEYNFNIY